MKKFMVSIEESIKYHVPVFANDEREAISTAEDAFANSEDDEEFHRWQINREHKSKVVA